jgi:AbrB family looped-hinge helix DNA binding protein
MRVTIDSAGRLVVPKPFRDALGLSGGDELEIDITDDGRLELKVPTTAMQLEQREKRVVAVAERKMPKLSQRIVRDTLERARRAG